MAYKQVIPFSTSKAGKQKGYCEKNNREGYGLPAKYGSAWENWEATDQHTGTPPKGVTVPAFFWYKNASNGHVGEILPDGRFWSDGTIYESIPAYEKNHDPEYRGWSTHFEGVQVVKQVADPKPSPSSGKRLYFDPVGQTATFYKVSGGTFAMKIKDSSYNWKVLENQGNRVRVNSASAGGDCWVYLKYSATGKAIPGRYVK